MRWLRWLSFVGLAATLAVSGCGPGTETTTQGTVVTSQPTTPAASTAAQTSTPVKDMASFHAVIGGTVQGVGYRDFVRSQALRFDISGTVQNLTDGTVEVYAEGERSALENFIAQLNIGPTGAVVKKIEPDWAPYIDQYQGFTRLN